MLFKSFPLILITVMSVVLLGLQIPEKQALQKQSAESSLEELKQATAAQTARLRLIRHLPALGFNNVIANATFIDFLQYFGDSEIRKQTGYATSSEFFEAMIHHDPYYRVFYLFLSGSNTIHAGNPDKTVDLIAKGLNRTTPTQPSDSYYIWRYKAVDELLFLGDGISAQQSFSTAANWASQSNEPFSEQVGEISRNTARFLADNPDSKVAQIDAWSSLLSTALDQDTRNRAIKKIESLGGSVLVSANGEISIRYEKAEESELDKSSDI